MLSYSWDKYSRLFFPFSPKERDDLQFLLAAENWFVGASVAENEPAAGGSSLSRCQPPLGSQATISGHINDFLPPGFVLYF